MLTEILVTSFIISQLTGVVLLLPLSWWATRIALRVKPPGPGAFYIGAASLSQFWMFSFALAMGMARWTDTPIPWWVLLYLVLGAVLQTWGLLILMLYWGLAARDDR